LKRIFNVFALKSSPEGEDLDGGAFDFKVKSTPHPSLPPQGKETSIFSISTITANIAFLKGRFGGICF